MTESKLKMIGHLNTTATILIAIGPGLLGGAVGMLINVYVLDAKPASLKSMWFLVGVLGGLGLGAMVWFAIEKFHLHNELPGNRRRALRIPGLLRAAQWVWGRVIVDTPAFRNHDAPPPR